MTFRARKFDLRLASETMQVGLQRDPPFHAELGSKLLHEIRE